jgi:hypothetical protein
MRGYIYLLISHERSAIVKIGRTTQSPAIRCKELNKDWYLSLNTWEVHYWRWVENCFLAEARIHKLLAKHRLEAKSYREAFRISLPIAMETVVRICDAYPPKSNAQFDPILKKRAFLDKIAYTYISKKGPLSEKIIGNKIILNEVDFYKWLQTIKAHIES